jgi:hypothetical protein
MNNLVQLAVFAALVTATAPAGAAQSAPRLESDRGSYEIVGVGTNGLQPDIYLSRSPSGWEMQIQFLADSPLPPRTWLKPTNIVGSEVALSLTNGTPIPTRSPDALAAYHLPVQTKVQEVLRGVPRPTPNPPDFAVEFTHDRPKACGASPNPFLLYSGSQNRCREARCRSRCRQ